MAKNQDKKSQNKKKDGKDDLDIGKLEGENSKTSWGRNLEAAGQEILRNQYLAAQGMLEAGPVKPSKQTKAYMEGLGNLGYYGDKEQKQALGRSGDLYGDYRRAGKYDKTSFKDLERKYGKAGAYDAMELEGLRRDYREAGQYDPSEFSRSDYRTQNIQERMSPYEQLVADRQRARLKRTYDEARGERELQAARAGAFGGSGAAIQEELARRNYAEQLADLDAQSLQSGYEAAVQLYGKEVADRMAAETAEEQSRQFGKGAEFQGLEGILAARQAEEQSRQFGKNAEFQGLEGALAARQQTAAQVAAAKEAELAGLRGMQASTAQQAALAEQRKNMQIANLNAMQASGATQEGYNKAARDYAMDVAQRQADVMATVQGAPVNTTRTQGPSTGQQAMGYLSTAIGGLNALSDAYKTASGLFGGGGGGIYRRGGRVYSGGGLAELQPQYYSRYER